MARPDADKLFGPGLELGRDVVIKAQLRFRVRPPRSPEAREIVDRVVAAYDERVEMILGEVADVLRHGGQKGSSDQELVVAVDPVPVAKSASQPFRPGSRGGKWYRDARGNIRYGDPPEGRFMGNAGAPDAEPPPELPHLRPDAFLGTFGNDQALTGFLVGRPGAHGFTDGELRFLRMWYGTGESGGELFDAFLECAGLTRDDLKEDVSALRFGGQGLTYEEAVVEFFRAQESLFMGDGSGQDADWEEVFEEDVKPLLDGVFAKYEEAKGDAALQEAFRGEPRRRRARFYENARRREADVAGVADSVVGDWKPARQVDVAVTGMEAVGLISRRSRAERGSRIHDRPHLRDAVMMDDQLLGADGLVGDPRRLATLSASQLLLVFVASELHRRWDQHSRSFSAERQSDVGAGELGAAALEALASKSPQWRQASGVLGDQLDALVDRVVARLNQVNAGEGMPEPARGGR